VLTIAIPTFNRAAQLDRQLAWLAVAVAGHEHQVELVVSDNSSSDSTPEVTSRWQAVLGPELLQVRRQPENIGAIRNIRDCLVRAREPHVWVVGDDDVLSPAAVTAVVERLARHPDLALLNLGFSSRSAITGELLFARCYDVDDERVSADGLAAFSELLAHDYGGVALTSAQVYRADLVRAAVQTWTGAEDNLVVQIFWGAACAAAGDLQVTEQVWLECSAGTHFFVDDPVLHLRLGFVDVPELAQQLRGLGYPEPVLRELVLHHLARSEARVLLRAARHDARAAAAATTTYACAVRRVGWSATREHLRHTVLPDLRCYLREKVRAASGPRRPLSRGAA